MFRFFDTHKKIVYLLVFAAVAVTVASCAKESEQALMAQQTNNTCDTLNMKYSINVVPILSANCYSCHANGIVNAGVILDSYSNVLQNATNGNIIGAITHALRYCHHTGMDK
jgi:hypothetical protein